ncbi:MAG: cytochrome c, partial [Bacteroidota bacterium]
MRYGAQVILVSLFILATVIISCAGSIPLPSAKHAEWASKRWPGTELSQLSAGRELYIRNCSSCHSLYRPGSYPPQYWEQVMPEMMVKAKIGENEARDIVRYLFT